MTNHDIHQMKLRRESLNLGQKSRLLLCVLLATGLTVIHLPHIILNSTAHTSYEKFPWIVSHDTDIQNLPTSYYKPTSINKKVVRTDVLKDPDQRVSKSFKIQKRLKPRVSFWFDVYTKYGSQDHVIHHSEYPWIVFYVINTKKIMNGNGHYWTRYHRAKNTVSRKVAQIRRALRRLAKRKHYKKLTGLEKTLYNKLKWVRGKRKHVFAFASRRVRSQLGQRDFFLKGLRNNTKYMAYIEEEFTKQGLPQELTRLPFVESSFNESARSKVGASGIWQLMPATARDYARVTRYIDERNSPLKATHMAAKLLKQYKKQLKYWPVTVTAYNHGVGGIKKAIRKVRTSRLHTIIHRYKSKRLGFASKNFYASFLAALYAEKYHYEIFKNENIVKELLIQREVIHLSKKIKAQNLLRTLGLSKEVFISYNLDLKEALNNNTYLPKNLEVHLPIHHHQKIRTSRFKKGRSKKL